MSAKVYLIGAGPGDPELLTLKAKRVLETVDVILYDYLVHPNCLLLRKPESIIVCVGKSKGKHSQTQSEIHNLLLKYINQGKTIARLKGGDPLIFGRGGEEMEFLSSHKVPYEIIPGISSGSAVPTYAGIPLTHRDLSRSVAFVTGTTLTGDSLEKKCLPKADTLVFFMAVHALDEIAANLMVNDQFNANTPAALIENGTTAKQRVITGTLKNINDQKKKYNIKAPALFVVGQVVDLEKKLRWIHHLPLINKRFLVLREKSQASELVFRLNSLGAEVCHTPLIRFQENINECNKLNKNLLKSTNTILFTSSNAIRFFIKALLKNNCDSRDLSAMKIAVVGKKTAETLKSFGLTADIIPEQFNAESLLNKLKQSITKNEHYLLPTTSKASSFLESELKLLGAKVSRLNIYHTVQEENISLNIEENDQIIFMSPSSVDVFFEHLAESLDQIKTNLTMFAIGKTTEKKLRYYFNGKIYTPDKENMSELLLKIEEVNTSK